MAKSEYEVRKFLSKLHCKLESCEVTASTPGLAERFCHCLGLLKVTPQFIYTLASVGNEDQFGNPKFACRITVKNKFVGTGTGRSKTDARNCAIKEIVRKISEKDPITVGSVSVLPSASSIPVVELVQNLDGMKKNCTKKTKRRNAKKISLTDENNNIDKDPVVVYKVENNNIYKEPVSVNKVELKEVIDSKYPSEDKSKKSKEKKTKGVQVHHHYGPRVSGLVGFDKLIIKFVDKANSLTILKTSAEVSNVAIELLVERVSTLEVRSSRFICTVFVEGEAIADAVGKLEACKKTAADLALQYLSSRCTSLKVSTTDKVNEVTLMSKAQFKTKAKFLLSQEIISPGNPGYQMLLMLGWSQGEGLGKDHSGRLEPVKPNGMKFYGQKPVLKIGDITEHEVEAVIKQYVREDGVEDLSISAVDMSAAEVAIIKLFARKVNLLVRLVTCSLKEKNKYLVLIKNVGIQDIVEILKNGIQSTVYQDDSKHVLVNSLSSQQVVLSYQHMRERQGYPTQLEKFNSQPKTESSKILKKKSIRPCYQKLSHVYSDHAGGSSASVSQGYSCAMHMILQDSKETNKVPEPMSVATLCSSPSRGVLPSMLYPEGSTWQVFVAYVEHFDSLYINLVGDEMTSMYKDMEHQLNIWAQASSLLNIRAVMKVGNMYAARVGKKWFRVKLVQDLGTDNVACQLVDQGDIRMLPRANMLDLAVHFSILPAQAVAVSLHGLKNVKWKEWSVYTANTVEDILQHHKMVATVTNRQYLGDCTISPTKPRLVLTTTNQASSVNINQALVGLYAKTKPDFSSRLHNRPQSINHHHLPNLVFHTPLLLPSLPTTDDLLQLTIISSINSLQKFVVQQVQSLPDLHHLEQHMQRFYGMRFKGKEDKCAFARGDFVAVKNWRRDMMWCRAMVLRILEGGHMMVRFTDWGMYDIVPMVYVQSLPRQFRNLPCLAIYCNMAGVTVVDRDLSLPLFTGKEYIGQVLAVEKCMEQFQVRLEINLYYGMEEFIAGKKLVVEKRAAYKEDSNGMRCPEMVAASA